jgi:pimeloyl-ACP methyl ester carboxylesterase
MGEQAHVAQAGQVMRDHSRLSRSLNLAQLRRAAGIAALCAGVLALAGLVRLYRSDLGIARWHATVGSQVVATPCGRIEFALAGAPGGPPVLVVHGAGGGFDQSLYFAAPFANRGYRVIAMSRFGYLRTPLPVDASAEAQAKAHACLLDALHIERAAIIAASAGAPSATLFALRYPERTSALVLLVPAAYVPRPAGQGSLKTPRGTQILFRSVLRSDFVFWAASHVARDTLVRTILATPPRVVRSASREEQERVGQVLESILPVSLRRLGLINDAAVTSTLAPMQLERISAGTFIMSTEDDQFGTLDGARYTAEHMPRARLRVFADGGHLWVGHQEELVAEVDRFLETTAVSERP